MLAKIKDQYINQFEDKKKFEWFIKVIKRWQKRNKNIVKLENWFWYLEEKLEIQKEYKKKDKWVQINLSNINTLFKEWEKDIKISMLEKECESWMADYNQIKKEKLELEIKYNSLADRVGLLVSTKSNNSDTWKIFAITYVSVDFLYILIKYLWI